MPWIVKNDKEFEWVGKWATQQVADRGLRWMLVGFESPSGAMPVEGGQVVVDGVSAGRVTSVRHSAALGKVIGLAIVPQRARGRGRAVRRPGRRPAGRDARPSRAVLRPRGRAAQGMSGALDFLSPSLARDEGGFHPVARSAAERLFRAADATFEERDGWLVPTRGAGRGRASRPGRDRRSLAPRQARRPPGAAAALEGDGVDDVPSLAAARARRSTRSRARAAVGEQVAGDALVIDVTAAYTVLGAHRARGARARRPADPSPPLPVRAARSPTSPRTSSRRAPDTGSSSRRSSATTSPRSRSTARRRSAAGSSGSTPCRGRRRREGHLPPEARAPEPRRAPAALRRRDRRRRLARPRDGVLPRAPPRDHERRDPREELHRLRAPPAGTRRSSARTTGRPRARRSTARASRSTRSSPPSSTSTSCSPSTGTSRSRTPTARSSSSTSGPR